eukprot:751152-Hanusia_phi.AAC.5
MEQKPDGRIGFGSARATEYGECPLQARPSPRPISSNDPSWLQPQASHTVSSPPLEAFTAPAGR